MRYAQIAPLCDGEICYNIANNSFAFIALLARVKPGKLYGGPRFGGCVHLGASPFVISPGLSRASLGIRQGMRPLSLMGQQRGRKATGSNDVECC